MSETTQYILAHHQVRKSKAQKQAFRDYVRRVCEQNGYAFREERGALGAVNVIIGDADRAKLLMTAHYDTCARLPFPNFITPKCFALYLLYQLVLTAALMLPSVLLAVLLPLLLRAVGMTDSTALLIGGATAYAALIVTLVLLLAGPANRHTANDNTSGVTLVLDVLQALPEQLRGTVAFVLFDLEEAGLFGASGYRARHKEQTEKQLVVNFDCVSDGDHILLAPRKGALAYAELLRRAFPSTPTHTVEVPEKGVFYPSDQACFPRGVGVAALKRSRRRGILYMDRIHTARDTVYDESNIAYLREGAIRLTESLANSTTSSHL